MNNLRISHIEMKITKYYHIFIYDNSIEDIESIEFYNSIEVVNSVIQSMSVIF